MSQVALRRSKDLFSRGKNPGKKKSSAKREKRSGEGERTPKNVTLKEKKEDEWRGGVGSGLPLGEKARKRGKESLHKKKE